MHTELEIERKFTIDPRNIRPIEAYAATSGFARVTPETTRDIYFADTDGRLVRENIMLRVREENGRVTLDTKAPSATVGERFERIEKNYAFSGVSADSIVELLALLGFTPSCSVAKTRQPWEKHSGTTRLRICIDDVKGLGHFCEIEAAAPVGAPRTECIAALDELQNALRAWLGEQQTRSYRELALAAAAR